MQSITRTTNYYITLLDSYMTFVEVNAKHRNLNLSWLDCLDIALEMSKKKIYK